MMKNVTLKCTRLSTREVTISVDRARKMAYKNMVSVRPNTLVTPVSIGKKLYMIWKTMYIGK